MNAKGKETKIKNFHLREQKGKVFIGRRYLWRLSHIEDTRWKDTQHYDTLRKYKPKPQEDSNTHQLEWLK